MAPKARRRKAVSRKAGGRRKVGAKGIAAYEHGERERANNPPVGLVTPETDPESAPGRYEFDPHLDPSLRWAGKAERTSFEVPTVSLHVHERMEPRTILEAVRKGNGESEPQPSLFHANERPIREAIEFYRHRDHWTNRLIAGDSLLVMQSLLAKDGLGGQVQMVYMDPPYGISYGSNFQPFAGRPSATDGKGEDLTREPEQIRAFRDTWKLGIHSYLSYLRDRLLLARELLTESGSLFLQIGDENVHRAAIVLDDIFGAENRIATITFATTAGSSTKLLPQVADYLLWYAKDRKSVKHRELFELLTRSEVIEHFSWHAMVEESDGTCRKLSEDERLDPDKNLPKGARLFQRRPLTSQGVSPTGRSEPYKYGDNRWECPAGRHWSISMAELDRLGELNRLDWGTDRFLQWKRYENEVPGRRINNVWHRLMRAFDKRYVVETARSVVERALLLTTDPGDIVFDPTCGSGTTASVAEQWGRRWITCDTSRVALVLARQRLVTSFFDYYRLARPEDGVNGGFRLRTVPTVSPETLVSGAPPQGTRLYNDPDKDPSKKRVAGPFTVEAVPSATVAPLTEGEEASAGPGDADVSVARSGATSRRGQWLEELERTGVRGTKGRRLQFGRLEPLPGLSWLHADGEVAAREAETAETEAGLLAAEPTESPFTEPKRVVVSFGPEFAPLDKRQVARALEEAQRLVPRPKMVLFAAFALDPEAAKEIAETRWPGVTLLPAYMNTDLQTEDLKKKQASSESFWLVGQPDVALEVITGRVTSITPPPPNLLVGDPLPRVGPGFRLLRHRVGHRAVGQGGADRALDAGPRLRWPEPLPAPGLLPGGGRSRRLEPPRQESQGPHRPGTHLRLPRNRVPPLRRRRAPADRGQDRGRPRPREPPGPPLAGGIRTHPGIRGMSGKTGSGAGATRGVSKIRQLILNSPYEEPTKYWQYDRDTRRFDERNGRRPSGYRIATPGSTDPNDPGTIREIPLVNRLRPRIREWRDRGYPGVTGMTLRLLRHWKEREADDRRLFFCQREAIETLIWLREAPATDRAGIEIPSDGGAFRRICSKMATGTGKTVVMAMLLAWNFLNRAARPRDTRFARNALLVAPGLTVRQRLSVLDPSREDNYYREFDLAPSGMLDKLRQGRVVVRNWQALAWEDEKKLARKKGVDRRGPKSDRAWIGQVLGSDLARRQGDLLVINDEGHHAWRIPAGFRSREWKPRDRKQATIWIRALDRIHRIRRILTCYDFSATPFVPGAGTRTGETLFDWIVSDFGLDDAIESGLVKTPRVVIRENPQTRMPGDAKTLRPRLYRIYEDEKVKADLNRKAPEETSLPDLVMNAYGLLAIDWRETARDWERHARARAKSTPDGAKTETPRHTPPVMITVANRTETAARIHYTFAKRKVEIAELCEPEALLRIDSDVLRQAEESGSVTPESGRGAAVAAGKRRKMSSDAARLLRDKVNTVGRIGHPGERVANVISVEMLTEGWDAKTVTHIMGLRAFGSQLLCEQVIGRGLRRTSYDVDPRTGLFTPEYVNVFGVPFTFLPHEEGKANGTNGHRTGVEIVPGRCGITWPNVVSIESRFDRVVSLDWRAVDDLQLDGAEAVIEADLAPIVDREPAPWKIRNADLLKWEKEHRLQTQIFRTTQNLYDTLAKGWRGSKASFLSQLSSIVEDFIESSRVTISPPLDPTVDTVLWRRLVIKLQMNRVVRHLEKAIRRSFTTRLVPIFDREHPIGSTADMKSWYTSRDTVETKKSPVNVGVCDSSWEKRAIVELDRHAGVACWVKNDHLNFEIFYVYQGVVRKYRPDFLVRFDSGLMLILEIKGRYDDHAKEKNDALRQWVGAINQHGGFGTWTSDISTDPDTIRALLDRHATRVPTTHMPDRQAPRPAAAPRRSAFHPIPHRPAA